MFSRTLETALQPDVFSIGTDRLPVTNKGRHASLTRTTAKVISKLLSQFKQYEPSQRRIRTANVLTPRDILVGWKTQFDEYFEIDGTAYLPPTLAP